MHNNNGKDQLLFRQNISPNKNVLQLKHCACLFFFLSSYCTEENVMSKEENSIINRLTATEPTEVQPAVILDDFVGWD